MITMTCKCSVTSKTFKRLSESDFPNGWETDCCLEARADVPQIETGPEVVSDEFDASLERLTPNLEVPPPKDSNSVFIETKPKAAPTKKRRGRKPKAK